MRTLKTAVGVLTQSFGMSIRYKDVQTNFSCAEETILSLLAPDGMNSVHM